MRKTTDIGVRVVMMAVIFNTALFILKGAVGLLANSTALQADAVNSAGDTMSSLATLFGVRYAIKPHDDDHHYGHGKMEAVISLFVGLIILVSTGFLWQSIIKTITTNEIGEASVLAFIAALTAIAIKIFMYIRTMKVGKKINSLAVQTNAKDHRNDVFATSATAFAIALSLVANKMNIAIFKYAEPVAAAIMSIFIIKTGIEIISASLKMLMDAAPDKWIVDDLIKTTKKCDDIVKLNWLKCRTIGRGMLVDIAVEVDGGLSVRQGHDIADVIKDNIQSEFPDVLDVLVHINPDC